MTQQIQFNVITDFIEELLAELNLPSDLEESARFRNILEERVTSRVFLNIVKSLTPEQAALVSADLTSEDPSPDIIFGKLVHDAPHFQTVIARTLGEVRIELLNDLRGIANGQKD